MNLRGIGIAEDPHDLDAAFKRLKVDKTGPQPVSADVSQTEVGDSTEDETKAGLARLIEFVKNRGEGAAKKKARKDKRSIAQGKYQSVIDFDSNQDALGVTMQVKR